MIVFFIWYLSIHSLLNSWSTIIIILRWILPIFWNINMFFVQYHLYSFSIIISNVFIMLPLFWRSNTFRNKMHGYSISMIILYSRIMIIFLIWYFFLYNTLHCICSSIFIFIWILILFILPLFWNHNTIIPKIITNCITIIVSQFWIKLILFIWYYSLFSLFKCINLILCQFLLVFWYFNSL